MKPLLTGVFSVLCIAQLLGIAGSAIAATVEIESIVATGPIFSIVGLLAAVGCVVSRSPANLFFGLSTPVFSLCIFFWIFTNSWSPQQASVPVSSTILGYELAMVPLGLYALYHTAAPAAKPLLQRPWQFNLRSLFILIFIASLTLGAARPFLHTFGSSIRHYIAIIFCVLTLFGIGVTLWLSLRQLFPASLLVRNPREPIHATESLSGDNCCGQSSSFQAAENSHLKVVD
ncbi:MAG: hypothetical protein IAF94_26355 [Pirellulaceae bacterium]|nr:hypothetical protein [Pirellulaceae bacterium]